MTKEVDNINFGDSDSAGDFEPVEEQVDEEYTTEDTKPEIHDYNWTDYVLSELHDNELFEGNPTVDSLRRLVSKYIGTIIESRSTVITSTEKYAAVSVNIAVDCADGTLLQYCGLADASPQNTTGEFSKYLLSIAETRAEGRALRKILQLRKTISAEELSNVQQVITDDKQDTITDNQLNFIDIMSRNNGRGMNINVKNLIRNMFGKDVDIKKLTHQDGIKITNQLSTYQHKPETITNELKGYVVTWRDEQ